MSEKGSKDKAGRKPKADNRVGIPAQLVRSRKKERIDRLAELAAQRTERGESLVAGRLQAAPANSDGDHRRGHHLVFLIIALLGPLSCRTTR